jgi:hypothetical protein
MLDMQALQIAHQMIITADATDSSYALANPGRAQIPYLSGTLPAATTGQNEQFREYRLSERAYFPDISGAIPVRA